MELLQPRDIPKTAVDEDDVWLRTSHEVCNNCLHVWTVDARDKVEPQQVARLTILAHFCVVLAIGHFSLNTTFNQLIIKERQLSLLQQPCT